jgi:hypothetical protein
MYPSPPLFDPVLFLIMNMFFFVKLGSSHNIVINTESGYLYAVGSQTCSGGLHVVNLQTPSLPTHAGCYSEDGYTHDAQCVVYTGPDNEYQVKGKEDYPWVELVGTVVS